MATTAGTMAGRLRRGGAGGGGGGGTIGDDGGGSSHEHEEAGNGDDSGYDGGQAPAGGGGGDGGRRPGARRVRRGLGERGRGDGEEGGRVVGGGGRGRPGAPARPASARARRRAVDQQRAAHDRGAPRARGPGRVLDVRLNQLQERDPAVAGLAPAVRAGGPHRRGGPQPRVLLGEVPRPGGRGDEAARRALPGRPGQRLRRLATLRRARLADAGSRRQAGHRPLPSHRGRRVRGDRDHDPAAPRGGRLTTRLSTLALAAVVAPATIVAVLGWVSLRQWEASAELLFREQARDMASMAAGEGEMMLRHSEGAL